MPTVLGPARSRVLATRSVAAQGTVSWLVARDESGIRPTRTSIVSATKQHWLVTGFDVEWDLVALVRGPSRQFARSSSLDLGGPEERTIAELVIPHAPAITDYRACET